MHRDTFFTGAVFVFFFVVVVLKRRQHLFFTVTYLGRRDADYAVIIGSRATEK